MTNKIRLTVTNGAIGRATVKQIVIDADETLEIKVGGQTRKYIQVVSEE